MGRLHTPTQGIKMGGQKMRSPQFPLQLHIGTPATMALIRVTPLRYGGWIAMRTDRGEAGPIIQAQSQDQVLQLTQIMTPNPRTQQSALGAPVSHSAMLR